jgi:hypothetical protein
VYRKVQYTLEGECVKKVGEERLSMKKQGNQTRKRSMPESLSHE